jgi:hypothetical protein
MREPCRSTTRLYACYKEYNTVTDLINALPGNSSLKTVQHVTIEKAVFSVGPTEAPIDWLDSDHL